MKPNNINKILQNEIINVNNLLLKMVDLMPDQYVGNEPIYIFKIQNVFHSILAKEADYISKSSKNVDGIRSIFGKNDVIVLEQPLEIHKVSQNNTISIALNVWVEGGETPLIPIRTKDIITVVDADLTFKRLFFKYSLRKSFDQSLNDAVRCGFSPEKILNEIVKPCKLSIMTKAKVEQNDLELCNENNDDEWGLFKNLKEKLESEDSTSNKTLDNDSDIDFLNDYGFGRN
jgi:hypothetical protein